MKELKKLEQLFWTGRINRREFLSRTAALGLTAAASPLLFSGVSRAATPRKGGTLRVGIEEGDTKDTFRLDLALANSMYFIGISVRNMLAEIDNEGNVIPELAESWEASSDAKTWTVRLRKGVEFHNGKTFDADDVLFSYNIHLGEDSQSGAKPLLQTIAEIKKLDKQTVQFVLQSGNVDFPAFMAFPVLQMVPNNTSDFSIGTGAYIVEKFEPGVIATMKRNPNYWKAGRAHFDRVEIKCIADKTARMTALRTGVVHAINKVDARTADLLKRDEKIQVVQTPSRRHYYMPMLMDTAPYDNNDVRLALKYGIDRQQVVKTILAGYGRAGNDHPISPAYRFYDKDLSPRTYDPDKARYHLKKAGLEGHVFKLHTAEAAHNGAVDTALLFQQHAAKAGIQIEVVREASDGYWSEVWNKKPFCQSYSSGRITEDLMFTSLYHSGAPWNDTHFKNARFDQLLLAARSEQNVQKRGDMYAEMQKILKDEGGAIVMAFIDFVDGANQKVKFDKFSSDFELDGGRFAERWWFAS
jgi:peptide/nickel transport system substrate-binding protein